MRVLYFTCMTLLSAMLGSLPSAIAAPGAYNFQLIADTTTGAFQNFHTLALNNNGTVAFTATLANGSVGVFSSRGGPITTILGSGGNTRNVSINDAGTVAFSRENFSIITGGGLFTGSGGPITTIVSEGAVTTWTINNKGSVAFVGLAEPEAVNPMAIFVAVNGRLTQIPETAVDESPVINNNDMVLFTHYYYNLCWLSVSHAGDQPAIVFDAQSESSPIGYFESATINDMGVIALVADYKGVDEQGRSKSGIFTLTDGVLNAIVDTGTASPFLTLGAPAINNDGVIAFRGNLKAGGTGIFTGPDPIGDKVIVLGDPLFGSTISQFSAGPYIQTQWLNERGDVAFVAQLADGRKVIGLARSIQR